MQDSQMALRNADSTDISSNGTASKGSALTAHPVSNDSTDSKET